MLSEDRPYFLLAVIKLDTHDFAYVVHWNLVYLSRLCSTEDINLKASKQICLSENHSNYFELNIWHRSKCHNKH